MRQQLDIYASVVLCKSLPGFPTRHPNVDFAIIRENTEGEYSGLEHQSYPGVVENLKISTRAKAERISRFAFDFALKNGRKVCFHPFPFSPAPMQRVDPCAESYLRAQGQHHEAR
jgi:isocitrate dehydrogenase (NAD+)